METDGKLINSLRAFPSHRRRQRACGIFARRDCSSRPVAALLRFPEHYQRSSEQPALVADEGYRTFRRLRRSKRMWRMPCQESFVAMDHAHGPSRSSAGAARAFRRNRCRDFTAWTLFLSDFFRRARFAAGGQLRQTIRRREHRVDFRRGRSWPDLHPRSRWRIVRKPGEPLRRSARNGSNPRTHAGRCRQFEECAGRTTFNVRRSAMFCLPHHLCDDGF